MRHLLCVAVSALALAVAAPAQNMNSFLGRWDMTVTPASGNPWPQWMELTEKDGKVEGRVQPRGGAWRPVVGAKIDSGKLIVAVSPASQRGPAVSWELTSAGNDKITGVEKRGDTAGPSLSGVRAPKLDRPQPKAWTSPRPIFNGKDLTGWEPIGNVSNNKWVARNGELVNDNPEVAGPARTRRRQPENHGEVSGFQAAHRSELSRKAATAASISAAGMKCRSVPKAASSPTTRWARSTAIIAPPKDAELGLGKWTTFDITLVGRHVTVVRDGKVYHDNVEIPGPTGGALDSNEAEPGPFFLQGDHHGVIRYRNITISVPKELKPRYNRSGCFQCLQQRCRSSSDMPVRRGGEGER